MANNGSLVKVFQHWKALPVQNKVSVGLALMTLLTLLGIFAELLPIWLIFPLASALFCSTAFQAQFKEEKPLMMVVSAAFLIGFLLSMLA